MTKDPDAPLVSCVIIFLNGEDFIAEAIESVLAQTYPNWELALVDDGTTDGATAIARRYADAHPDRIRYLEHPGHANRGMSASRNAGVRATSGKYVALLDADDIWLPEKLERQVAVLERHPEAAMTFSPFLYWSSWDAANRPRFKPWRGADYPLDLGVPLDRPIAPHALATHYLSNGGDGIPGVCSLMIRRDALEAVGGFDESFRRLYEDQVLIFKILLRFPVVATGEVLDRYRQHAGSACWQDGGASGHVEARPAFLAWLQDYLIEEGVKDPELWKALRGEMWRFDNPRLWRALNLPNTAVEALGPDARQAIIWMLTPKLYDTLRGRRRPPALDASDA